MIFDDSMFFQFSDNALLSVLLITTMMLTGSSEQFPDINVSLGGSSTTWLPAVALAEVTPNCVVESHHEDDDEDEDDGGDDEECRGGNHSPIHVYPRFPPPPDHLVLSLHHSRGSVPDTPAILMMHFYLKQTKVLLI